MRKEYMIFENMLNCYKDVDLNARCDAECNRSFFFLAKTLGDMDVKNPFSFGEKGFSEYDDMMFFFHKWNKTKKTCAFKQRFLMAAYDLCDTVKENIFDKEDPVEVVSLDKMKEQEMNRIFGIVDADPVWKYKKSFDFETEYDGEDNEVHFGDNEYIINNGITNDNEVVNNNEVTDSDEVANDNEVINNNEVIDSNEVTDNNEVVENDTTVNNNQDNEIAENQETSDKELEKVSYIDEDEIDYDMKEDVSAFEEITTTKAESKKLSFIEKIKNILRKKH